MQLEAAASVKPDRLMLSPPAVAVVVPPHVPLKPNGLATTTPAGKVSVNAMPVNGVALGLVTVKDNADVPPAGMIAGVNALVRVGGT